jgi:Iron-sulfur cluster assembly accessory protein
MTVQLTESAARRVRGQIERRGSGVGLRLGIKKSGCSGYAYRLDYADAAGEDDAVFESHGASVVVARSDLALLDGVTVDFVRDGLNEQFAFHNPRAVAQCGCGESFAVAEEEDA